MTDHYPVNINLVNGTSVHYFLLFLVRLASESSSCLPPGFFLFGSFFFSSPARSWGGYLPSCLLFLVGRTSASTETSTGLSEGASWISISLVRSLSLPFLSSSLVFFLFCFFVTLFLFFSVWVNALLRLASEGDSCEKYPDSPPLVRGKLLPRAGISSFPVTFCGRTQEL